MYIGTKILRKTCSSSVKIIYDGENNVMQNKWMKYRNALHNHKNAYTQWGIMGSSAGENERLWDNFRR